MRRRCCCGGSPPVVEYRYKKVSSNCVPISAVYGGPPPGGRRCLISGVAQAIGSFGGWYFVPGDNPNETRIEASAIITRGGWGGFWKGTANMTRAQYNYLSNPPQFQYPVGTLVLTTEVGGYIDNFAQFHAQEGHPALVYSEQYSLDPLQCSV